MDVHSSGIGSSPGQSSGFGALSGSAFAQGNNEHGALSESIGAGGLSIQSLDKALEGSMLTNTLKGLDKAFHNLTNSLQVAMSGAQLGSLSIFKSASISSGHRSTKGR
jgi:hypothetical protein